MPEHHFLLREGRWKLLRATGFGRQQPAVDGPGFELYDLQTDPGETTDLAAEKPQLVARLRGRYRSWWDDVSTERSDNFDPPRIVLGGAAEAVATLTRQDIRMPEGRDWGIASPGDWWVDVQPAAGYRVDVRFPAWESESVLRVVLNGCEIELAVPVESAAATVTLRDVPTGPGLLRIERRTLDGPPRGIHQADVQAR